MNVMTPMELDERSPDKTARPGESIEERIAVLEERTRDKPKSVTDYVKEWAGVGTLMIALLYTFPLGVWDRFFVTQVDRLRDLAIHLSELDAENARSYFSIEDDQVRAFFSRAMSSKKAALIEREIANLQANYDELSSAEMILLAYNVGLSGKRNLADEIYKAALTKARNEQNISFVSDIYRLRAQLYAADPNGLNDVRESYSRAIGTLMEVRSPVFQLQISNSAFEWAVWELSSFGGDWACGQSLGALAIQIIEGLPHVNPEIATYEAQYRRQLAQFQRRADHSDAGCKEALVPWLDSR
jgi:hypothetical protein